MSHPVRTTSRAQADIAAAQTWYETRRPGLGQRFLLNVNAALERIAERPELYRTMIGDARRARIEGFRDYGVWYRVKPDHSLVIACVSSRQQDAVVRRRMFDVV